MGEGAGRQEREGREQLDVVVTEEPQTDRDRDHCRREPEPQVDVALTVERMLRAVTPGARELPQQRQVAPDERGGHRDEHHPDRGRERLHAEVRPVAQHGPVEEVAGTDDRGTDQGRHREAERDRGDAALPASTSEQIDDREQCGRARPFGQRRERDGNARSGAAPVSVPAASPPSSTAT